MPNDWLKKSEPGPYEQGRYQADRFCGQPMPDLVRTLQLSWRRREEMGYRLFPSKERQYLDGFIVRLEEEIERRTRDGMEFPELAAGLSIPAEPPPELNLEVPPDPILRFNPGMDAGSGTPRTSSHWEAPDFLFEPLPDEPNLPRGRRSTQPAPGDSWDLPGFLFTGIPEELPAKARERSDSRNGDATRGSATWQNLDALFAHWSEETRAAEVSRAQNGPSSAAVDTRPIDSVAREFLYNLNTAFVDQDGGKSGTGKKKQRSRRRTKAAKEQAQAETLPAYALEWSEPPEPKIPLRVKIKMLWYRFLDLLQFEVSGYHEWEA